MAFSDVTLMKSSIYHDSSHIDANFPCSTSQVKTLDLSFDFIAEPWSFAAFCWSSSFGFDIWRSFARAAFDVQKI